MSEESDRVIVVKKQANESYNEEEFVERRALAERNACRTACDRDAEPGGNRSRTRQDTCSEYSGTFDSTQEPDALAAHVRICAGGLIQRVEIPL